MIDTIGPAIDALKAASAAGDDFMSALRKSLAAAEAGMKSTIPMLPRKAAPRTSANDRLDTRIPGPPRHT